MSYRLILFILLIATPSLSFAENAGALYNLEMEFKTLTEYWFYPIKQIAFNLLFTLATISLVWTAATMILKGLDFNEIVFTIVRFVMVIGFFYWLIRDSPILTKQILSGFAEAANEVARYSNLTGATQVVVTEVTAANVLDRGLALSQSLYARADGIAETIIYFTMAAFVVVCYAFISATVLLVQIEVYIVVTAGVLLLGFAGSSWTDSFAKKYLIYMVSVGMKLFVTFLIVGIGESMITTWVADLDTSQGSSLMALLGILWVLVYLTQRIPVFAQSLISGASIDNQSSAAAGMAASAARASAAVAMSATGAAATATAAMSLARQQAAPNTDGSLKGAALRGGSIAGNAIKNLGGAAMATAGQKGMGMGANGGMKGAGFGQQMAQNIKSTQEELSSKTGNAGSPAAGSSNSISSGYSSPAGKDK